MLVSLDHLGYFICNYFMTCSGQMDTILTSKVGGMPEINELEVVLIGCNSEDSIDLLELLDPPA